MTQELMTQLAGFGAIGIIGGTLFKSFLAERDALIQERKEETEYFKQELATTRELYKVELAQDRDTYINSIDKIINRMNVLEEDVKDIKNKLEDK